MIHHRNRLPLLSACLGLSLLIATNLQAQYPTLSDAVKAEASAKAKLADKLSDEAWERALPAVKEGEAKGKPYLPWAAKPDDLPQAKIPAFPGAFGGGMYSFGGRGGRVLTVTNLNDSGPGSFREACEAAGPRIIVFNVAGIIRLDTRIRVRAPYVTIAGNTAPGDGVCIAGNTVELETHDVILRHLRFRRGATLVGDRNDSLGGNPIGNIMIDHVSASWGLDENLSMYRHMYRQPKGGPDLKLPTVNITIQNSISSEALDRFHHAFGSTIGGRNSTFHHNLWACNTGRNPSVGMDGDFTFVNNVLFNWVHRSVDGGDEKSYYNIISNYFKPGPSTPADKDIGHRLLKPESSRDKTKPDTFGKAYVIGNVVEGNEPVTADNWADGVQIAPKNPALTQSLLARIRADKPYPHAPLVLQSAKEAYDFVLANAGATLPRRDAVDLRVIEMVRSGKVTRTVDAPEENFAILGSKREVSDSYKRGIIVHPAQVGGYPEYKGTPYVDSDRDGMPDAWETAHGLNPKDASDATKDANGDGYTNIEKFLYGLDPRAPKTDWTDLKNNRDTLKSAR
jgi:hypothetical protein